MNGSRDHPTPFDHCDHCGCNLQGTKIYQCRQCKKYYCDLCGRAQSVYEYFFCPRCEIMLPLSDVQVGVIVGGFESRTLLVQS